MGEFKSNVQETNSHTCAPVARTGDVVSMQVEPEPGEMTPQEG